MLSDIKDNTRKRGKKAVLQRSLNIKIHIIPQKDTYLQKARNLHSKHPDYRLT